jgi:hypothetical protein
VRNAPSVSIQVQILKKRSEECAISKCPGPGIKEESESEACKLKIRRIVFIPILV